MSAPPTPRAVVTWTIWNFITGEPATVNERADAILAALAAAPVETRIALARDLLAGTTHAVVPREPTEAMMAALTGYAQCHGYVEEGYRAMLAAATTEGKSDAR